MLSSGLNEFYNPIPGVVKLEYTDIWIMISLTFALVDQFPRAHRKKIFFKFDMNLITAVIPYLGYARQDRRSFPGEPVGARVIADILNSGLDRLFFVDLHEQSLEGFFSVPVEHVSAVSLLAERLSKLPLNRVIVTDSISHQDRSLWFPVEVVSFSGLDCRYDYASSRVKRFFCDVA